MELLERGDAAAAATLLDRAHAEEPASASVLEALARARYDSGQYEAAAQAFAGLVAVEPSSDYAHFGLGLTLFRLGRVSDAEPHLAMAAAMRPERPEYGRRLREVRATRAARDPGAKVGRDVGAGPGGDGAGPGRGTGQSTDRQAGGTTGAAPS
jgi:tetratricopeptide (TPR) repeat protein